MNEEQKIERISQLLSSAYRISNKCEDNMKRLNQMMLELKGIVAMVRPRAKKNDWYGDELEASGKVHHVKEYLTVQPVRTLKGPEYGDLTEEKDKIQIEYESTN